MEGEERQQKAVERQWKCGGRSREKAVEGGGKAREKAVEMRWKVKGKGSKRWWKGKAVERGGGKAREKAVERQGGRGKALGPHKPRISWVLVGAARAVSRSTASDLKR